MLLLPRSSVAALVDGVAWVLVVAGAVVSGDTAT